MKPYLSKQNKDRTDKVIVMREVCLMTLFSLFVCIPISAAQIDYNRFISPKERQEESYLQQVTKWWNAYFNSSYAIIIAIGEYDYNSPLPVQDDAKKMKDFLLSSGEYDEVIILQNADATFQTIRYFMEAYFPQKMKDGRHRFLFYFTGHGIQRAGYGDKPIGYLQLKGATTEPNTEEIDMSQLENWAKKLRFANHMLFLIDCCFSGLAGRQDKGYVTTVKPEELAKQNGRFMITAGGADETSLASEKRWGGSLFTDVVISGMRGDADTDHDGIVTTYELFDYVQRAVVQESKNSQHPLISNLGEYNDKGQYFFVYKVLNPTPILSPQPTMIIKSGNHQNNELKGKIEKARIYFNMEKWELAAQYYYEAAKLVDMTKVNRSLIEVARSDYEHGGFEDAAIKFNQIFADF